jgi:hypothetical protein
MKLYSYREANDGRPDWAPLVAIAQRTAARANVPTIKPDDFMWMCAMESLDGGAPLHLYKHIDTRRYLNVDTDLRMYAWVDDLDDDLMQPAAELVVHYRRLGGLAWAIERLDLGWRRFHDDALDVLHVAADNCVAWPANVTPLSRHRRRPGGSVA